MYNIVYKACESLTPLQLAIVEKKVQIIKFLLYAK